MEHPSVSGQSTADAHPLLVFFDIETTGLNIYNERITEIAAKVVGDPVSTVTKASYTSLVSATKSIPPKVQELTGINNDMLKEERPLCIVLPEFLKWLVDTAKEASDENTVYYPVLVAHNGFTFDYPMLLAEIKRTPEISFQSLKESNIHFADTLPHLRKVVFQYQTNQLPCSYIAYQLSIQAKKEGHAALTEVQKFGLRNLYCHFVQHKYIGTCI
jgi:DNA polymerase III alpha subunit (gram-positive type)